VTTPKLEALGLPLTGDDLALVEADGALVVDVVLVAKVLRPGDGVGLVLLATPDLLTYEAAGMALALLDRLRAAMTEKDDGG
jgi:hypothetical protein